MWKRTAEWVLGIAALGCCLGGDKRAAERAEREELERAKAAAFAAEERKLWQQVNWQRDPVAALAQARAQNKPLLVFMLVNKMGVKGAGEC